ncbi:MAG: dicarboxylate/amino acid:cation symporter [Gammaproteobacteria bacterium]|nr:dicarboxylate/amino acid:cation symporter [Gammaproteobacteria bacterium]
MDRTLHWQILGALVLAAICGFIFEAGTGIGDAVLSVFDFVGGLFLNALKMIVVPLILSTIVLGIARMASQDSFGRVGAKTVGLYLMTGIFAIASGLFFVNLIAPGVTEHADKLVANIGDTSGIMERVEGRTAADLIGIIERAIPANIFSAAAETQLLALIFVGVVFGFFMSKLQGSIAETMTNFWTGVNDVMIMITMWIMRFAPLGVLALVGTVAIKSGWSAFQPLLTFAITVLLALAVHFAVILPLLLKFFGGVNPIQYYAAVSRAQLTAFSTASSSATLPVTIRSAENAGVSKRITGFVLPLGATVNMDGTALYECVVVIFIAQILATTSGVEFTIMQQLTVVILALLTSIGVAGVPAASLVAITLILTAVGLPVEFIGIVLAVDRILDMCRTAVNVTSDLSITAIIANSEGDALDAANEEQEDEEEAA